MQYNDFFIYKLKNKIFTKLNKILSYKNKKRGLHVNHKSKLLHIE